MHVRLHGVGLPGRSFGDEGAGGCAYDDVQVGVQRGKEVEQLAPGDSDAVVFEVDLRPAGDLDARGPYAHDRPGQRFIYLCWVAGAERRMFRRAKLMLADVPVEAWREAQQPGRALEATVALTDARGGPRCATVRPPAVSWRAVASP